MATDLERLLIRLEVSQRKFERQLSAADRAASRRAKSIEKRFDGMSRRVSKGFDRIGRSGTAAFQGIGRVAAVAATAFGTRELTRYADAWNRVENQIRAAEKISGTQARTTSELVDLSNRSRAGLNETANLYARLLRVSGNLQASEMQVAQATETVAKAFKAGGAAASEQASGVLQLSQALGSGVLQGDELRSLRENAPLIAQAIANEFETTIGGLKELGAQGELTSARVFKAILNAQKDIEGAFAVTTPLIADGFTALKNGVTEMVAAFSQGSGAGSELSGSMADLGAFLSENADAAERFGNRVAEALAIVQEIAGGLKPAFDLAFEVVKEVPGAVSEMVDVVMEAIKVVVSNAAGVAGAVAAAMLAATDAVASGAVGIANAAISAVDGILDKITSGINSVIQDVNSLLVTVGSATIPPILRQGLEQIEAPSARSPGVSAAFTGTRDKVRGSLDRRDSEGRQQILGKLRRIQRAGETPFERNDPRGNQIASPKGEVSSNPTRSGAGSELSSSGGGGSKTGRSKKAAEDLFATVEREKQALRDRIDLIGLTERETVKLQAAQKLLAEANKRGLDLDKRRSDTGKTLREEIDAQAESIAALTERAKAYEDQAALLEGANETLKDGLVDAIIEGESFSDVLKDVAKQLARAAVEAALFGGAFGSGTGGGGGLIGGLLGGVFGGKGGGLLSFDGGGYTGPGSRSGGVDGRGGFPAILHPNETVIDHTKGQSGGGGAEIVIRHEPGMIVEIARGEAVNVTQAGIAQNNRSLEKRQGRPGFNR